uniref:Uncharacterized protein n=1 Tax=Anguilla anguilla TaxID=7936 RepID=A0A0E9USJ6_ANGAN
MDSIIIDNILMFWNILHVIYYFQ